MKPTLTSVLRESHVLKVPEPCPACGYTGHVLNNNLWLVKCRCCCGRGRRYYRHIGEYKGKNNADRTL